MNDPAKVNEIFERLIEETKSEDFPVSVSPDMKCKRCNGKGYLSAYRHVQNGVCFGCGGKGFKNNVGCN